MCREKDLNLWPPFILRIIWRSISLSYPGIFNILVPFKVSNLTSPTFYKEYYERALVPDVGVKPTSTRIIWFASHDAYRASCALLELNLTPSTIADWCEGLLKDYKLMRGKRLPFIFVGSFSAL